MTTRLFEEAILEDSLDVFVRRMAEKIKLIVLWLREDQTLTQNKRTTLSNLIIHLVSQKELAEQIEHTQILSLSGF
jgi:hypothetical protein